MGRHQLGLGRVGSTTSGASRSSRAAKRSAPKVSTTPTDDTSTLSLRHPHAPER